MPFSFALPTEITTQILRYHFKSASGSTRQTNYYAPIQVCSPWRQAALRDPQSWSTIEIRIDFPALVESVPETGVGDPKPFIEHLLLEVRWKLAQVKHVPIDLTITFEEIDSYYDVQPAQCHVVLNMIQDSLQTTFGPKNDSELPRVKLDSYREEGFAADMQEIDRSFLNEFLPVMQADQFQNLRFLEIFSPRFDYPVTFPNLRTLKLIDDMCILNTLSSISAPSLLEIFIPECNHDPSSYDPEQYLAPVLARFPSLCELTLDAGLSVIVMPPSDHGRYENTSVRILTLEIGGDWEYSPFLRAFPNLENVCTVACRHNIDKLGSMAKGENVTSATFVMELFRDLLRISVEAFPNLKYLRVGSIDPEENIQTRNQLRDVLAIGPLAEVEQVNNLLIPTCWPRLEMISLLSIALDYRQLIPLIQVLQTRSLRDMVEVDPLDQGRFSRECRISTKNCSLQWDFDRRSIAPSEIPDGDMSLEEFINVAVSILSVSVGKDRKKKANLRQLIKQLGLP